MQYRIQTHNKAKLVTIQLVTNVLREIEIIAYDPKITANRYFSQITPVNGSRNIQIRLPLTPKLLYLSINDINSDSQTFGITNIKVQNMILPYHNYDKTTRYYILSIFELCKMIPTISTGLYQTKNKRFNYHIYDVIRDHDTGRHVPTPARIHKDENFIEISKSDFLKLTISERILILLHEYSHNYLNYNMDNEQEADSNGLKMFIDLGFPYIEGESAFTKIFPETSISHNRLNNVENYLIHRNNLEFNYGLY